MIPKNDIAFELIFEALVAAKFLLPHGIQKAIESM
jgi:hypothetical protein